MNKKEIIGMLSVLFLIAILFSPITSSIGFWFFSIGLIFGITWFFM